MTTSIQAPPVAEPPLTGLTVQDVMVTVPKTMRPTATVADARAFFEDDHVHMALIATSGTCLGRWFVPISALSRARSSLAGRASPDGRWPPPSPLRRFACG